MFHAPAPVAEQLSMFAAPASANPFSAPIGVSTYTGPISAPPGMPPTGEQQNIMDAFRTGGPVVMVKMVQRYGPGTLIDTINRLSTQDKSEVTVSTAHKAKGLEWPQVRIGNDFAPPKDGDKPDRAELMLAYVSVTRAQNGLDVGSLAWRREGYVDPDDGLWFTDQGTADSDPYERAFGDES